MLNEEKYHIDSACDKTGGWIMDDEPVFLLRAKDKHSVPLLRCYASLVHDPRQHEAILDLVIKFQEWQKDKQLKEPTV